MTIPRVIPRAEHPISRSNIDPDALRVLYRLHRSGYKSYLVGGSVRDLMMGRTPKDFDIGTDARPQEIRNLFRNSRIIGRRFRLTHVYFEGGHVVEVSTFRKRPGEVDAVGNGAEDILIREDNTFGSPEEDALRRDFTINGLFYDIASFAVLDYVGGVEDLANGLIRTIGDPVIRFREDPVRMLRACEFAARLGFSMTPEVDRAIREHRSEIRKSAAPRVAEELLDPLRRGWGAATYRLWSEIGLLDVLISELDREVTHGSREATADQTRQAASGLPAEDQPSSISGSAARPPDSEPHAAARRVFWRMLEDADRRRSLGEAIPEATLLGILVVPMLLATIRRDASQAPSGDQGLEPNALLLALDRVVDPLARRLGLAGHTVHAVKTTLFAMGRLADTPPSSSRARRLMSGAALPPAVSLLSLYSAASGRYAAAAEAWEELALRTGRLHRLQARDASPAAAAVDGDLSPGPHGRRRVNGRRVRALEHAAPGSDAEAIPVTVDEGSPPEPAGGDGRFQVRKRRRRRPRRGGSPSEVSASLNTSA